jgi:hypothetical protein
MTQEFQFVLDTEYRLAQAIACAVFFILFLIVFLPFGVSNYDPNHEYTLEFLMAMSLFGVSTGVTILASEFLLKPQVPGANTLRGVVLWSVWTCGIVGLANYLLYNLMGQWHDFGLLSALLFVINCTAVLVFPLIGTFFFFRYRDLRSSFEAVLERDSSGSDPDQLVTFAGTGTGDRIVLRLQDFLYGQAQDNYVELHYQEGDEPHRHLLRATLTSLTKETEGTGIERCHRSYMVNLGRVTRVRGSGSSLYLSLEGIAEPIPISRSYREQVLASLRTHRGLTADIPG